MFVSNESNPTPNGKQIVSNGSQRRVLPIWLWLIPVLVVWRLNGKKVKRFQSIFRNQKKLQLSIFFPATKLGATLERGKNDLATQLSGKTKRLLLSKRKDFDFCCDLMATSIHLWGGKHSDHSFSVCESDGLKVVECWQCTKKVFANRVGRWSLPKTCAFNWPR